MASLAGVAAAASGVLLTAIGAPLLSAVGGTVPPLPILLAGNTSVAWLIFVGWFYFGEQRFLSAGAVRTIPLLAAAAVVPVVALSRRVTTEALYISWVVPSLVVGVVVVGVLHRHPGFGRFSISDARRSLSFGLRFSAGQVAQLGALRLDQWLVAAIVSTQAVGIYSIAAASSEAVLVAATAIGVVVFSDTARGSTDMAFRRQLIAALTAVTLLAGLLAMSAPTLVPALFGERYAGATTPLLILLLGTPGLVLLRLITNRLAGLASPGTASVCSVVTLLVTVALDLLLIPRLGINGAAVASSVGYSIGGVAGAASLRRRTRQAPTTQLANVT